MMPVPSERWFIWRISARLYGKYFLQLSAHYECSIEPSLKSTGNVDVTQLNHKVPGADVGIEYLCNSNVQPSMLEVWYNDLYCGNEVP